jgi:hypothetical protein
LQGLCGRQPTADAALTLSGWMMLLSSDLDLYLALLLSQYSIYNFDIAP